MAFDARCFSRERERVDPLSAAAGSSAFDRKNKTSPSSSHQHWPSADSPSPASSHRQYHQPRARTSAIVSRDAVEDAQTLFEQVKRLNYVSNSNRKAKVSDLDLCALYTQVFFANLFGHDKPKRGLANAMQVSMWMRSREFVLPPKAWSRVVLKMIELESPVEFVMEWIESQPVADLNREMTFVLASALDHLKKPQVVLELLQEYINIADLPLEQPREVQESQGEVKPLAGLLRYLLPKFLETNPTIDEVEKYLSIMSENQADVGWQVGQKVVGYYLNPLHHERGIRALDSIATRFMLFLRNDAYLLKWHNNGQMTSSGGTHDRRANSAASFYAVLTRSLHQLDEEDREPYLFATYSHGKNPDLLYDMARLRFAHETIIDTDYDMYLAAVMANMEDHENPAIGLANAMEISRWMREKADYPLVAQAWASILLRMIEMEYPVEEMTEWMDAYAVSSSAGVMAHVLVDVLQHFEAPAVFLGLLQHFLFRTGRHASPKAKGDLLSGLLDPFLAVHPSLQQLEEFVACFRSNRRMLTRNQCRSVVTFYLAELHHLHSDNRTGLTHAIQLTTFLKQHEDVFKNLDLRETATRVGQWVAQAGPPGIPVADQLLQSFFVSNGKRRREFAEAVTKQLTEDGEAQVLAQFRQLMALHGVVARTAS